MKKAAEVKAATLLAASLAGIVLLCLAILFMSGINRREPRPGQERISSQEAQIPGTLQGMGLRVEGAPPLSQQVRGGVSDRASSPAGETAAGDADQSPPQETNPFLEPNPAFSPPPGFRQESGDLAH